MLRPASPGPLVMDMVMGRSALRAVIVALVSCRVRVSSSLLRLGEGDDTHAQSTRHVCRLRCAALRCCSTKLWWMAACLETSHSLPYSNIHIHSSHTFGYILCLVLVPRNILHTSKSRSEFSIELTAVDIKPGMLFVPLSAQGGKWPTQPRERR